MDDAFVSIAQDLERLRTAAKPVKIFGAASHGFLLNPALSEPLVAGFEASHRVTLPTDYRLFLTRVGNGGAGPHYGLFRLGEMDDNDTFQEWRENDGLVGCLSAPFPHSASWNDLTGEPENTADERAYEQALESFDSHYWSPRLVDGAIPICHEGCAYRDWLVITGPERGHVWHDARADRKGIFPVSGGTSERVSFLVWYRRWLDEALAKFPKRP